MSSVIPSRYNSESIRKTTMKSLIASVLSALVLAGSVLASPVAAPAAQNDGRYLVVLKPEGTRPDFEGSGAVVEFSQGLYHVIRLPKQDIEGIRRNPNVHYIQRHVPPEEALAIHRRAAAERSAPSSQGVVAQVAPSPVVWSSGAYQYDGSGNIRSIGSHTYAYDSLGRLVRANYGPAGAPPNLTEVYAYDAFGNMTSRMGAPRSVGTIGVDTATNRLAGWFGASYDGAGNLTRFGSEKRNYDPGRMMRRRVWEPKTTYYVYDARDERVAVIDDYVDNLSTWTVRGLDGQVLRQFTRLGNNWFWEEDVIHRDGKLLAAQRIPETGGALHYQLDHLGTPRQITSAFGEELSRHDYDPFGTEATSLLQLPLRGRDPNRLQFTGHERDYHSGVFGETVDYDDYMHARYYSPAMGRFLSVDPGKDWDMHQPQSWNMYGYVRNNPINATDPDGRAINLLSPDNWVDLGSAGYGIVTMRRKVLRGEPVTLRDNAAVAVDLGAAIVPGLTGGGAIIRNADEVADATADAARYTQKSYKRVKQSTRNEVLPPGQTTPCTYCRKPANSVDHVESRKAHYERKGKTQTRDERSAEANDPNNLAPACIPCNSKKRDKPVDEFVKENPRP